MDRSTRSAFDSACEYVKTGSFIATNDEKLMLYALYKMCTVGRCQKEAHAIMMSPVDRAKQKAWLNFSNAIPLAEAPSRYISLVNELRHSSRQGEQD